MLDSPLSSDPILSSENLSIDKADIHQKRHMLVQELHRFDGVVMVTPNLFENHALMGICFRGAESSWP
jgi:hypothetical protein